MDPHLRPSARSFISKPDIVFLTNYLWFQVASFLICLWLKEPLLKCDHVPARSLTPFCTLPLYPSPLYVFFWPTAVCLQGWLPLLCLCADTKANRRIVVIGFFYPDLSFSLVSGDQSLFSVFSQRVLHWPSALSVCVFVYICVSGLVFCFSANLPYLRLQLKSVLIYPSNYAILREPNLWNSIHFETCLCMIFIYLFK